MIGVPLQGGKTLQVTFRSLNTRTDIFRQAQPQRRSSDARVPQIKRKFEASQLGKKSPRSNHNENTSQEQHMLSLKKQQDEFKKAVQIGVMRGISNKKNASTRKNPYDKTSQSPPVDTSRNQQVLSGVSYPLVPP